MKKVIINIIFLAIIVLACFSLYKGMLGRFAIDEEKVNYEEYEELYYYSQLTDEQKELYIKLDLAINELNTRIHLGFTKTESEKLNLDKILDAICYDRPEYYFLPDQYNIRTVKLFSSEYVYVELKYDVKDRNEREKKDLELEKVIQQILYETITDDMTDIEKEIAIHDRLVEEISYYNYQSIENIPYEKHTAYEALVNKEAVCDGISKAMMILLNKVGIETIMVVGDVKEIPHAWNIVKLDGEYYHVDATSDYVDLNSKKYIIHNYLNVSDSELKKTHTVTEQFELPECNGTKYNYYRYKDFGVDYTESMRSKLAKIINKQLNSKILEVKIDELYSIQNVLEALYFLDFNDWHTNGKTSVAYHNIGNVYIFENEMKRRLKY